MSRQSLPAKRWEIREEMSNLHGGTRMLSDQQVADAIVKVVSKYNVCLVSTIRNIQLSIDVQLDQRPDNTSDRCKNYRDRAKMESEIHNIKGVVINDIFYRDGNYKNE